jgi:hypothetical protein
MKVFEYLDRINRMHKLVFYKKTGTPSEFAGLLGVSRTTLYEMIDELRSRGAPIQYSKSQRTFFYDEPFEINISCSLRPLSQKEEKQFAGGIYLGRVLFSRTLGDEISVDIIPWNSLTC